MFRITYLALRLLLCLSAATHLFAQDKPGPDVLILVDGEKLIGHLKSATGSKVVFKSDLAGLVTVEWSKIQELRSGDQFAVLPKGVEFRNSEAAAKVPQGTL